MNMKNVIIQPELKQKQHLWNQQTFDDIKNLSSSIGNNCKMMELLALVYSASKFPNTVDYGYVKDNLQGVKYFENCLTWNIDGSIGKVYNRKGRFSLSEKVIPLIVQKEYTDTLDLLFLNWPL